MLKGKLVFLSLIAAALLCWQVMPASVDTVNSGIVDPCSSSASIVGGPYCWIVCPQGDGPPLNALLPGPLTGDATITVTVKDQTGTPIAGIPANDFWLVGCEGYIVLCGGAGSIDATAATDALGQTTINGSMAAGNLDAGQCEDEIQVVVQGTPLQDVNNNCDPLCLAIKTRSVDLDANLEVRSGDFNRMVAGYVPIGGTYDKCTDYDCSGDIFSTDFTRFVAHWNIPGDPATVHLCD